MSEQNTKIYIDLDSLLDTRMGLLASLDVDKAVDVLNSDYHKRFIDKFPGISASEFKELYSKRTADILPFSLITETFEIIHTTVKEAVIENMKGGQNLGHPLTVNIFPYELEPDEIEEMRDVIFQLNHGCSDVELISMSNDDLTPEFIKKNYCMVIKYDFADWLHIQQNNLVSKPIPAVIFIAPSLYYDCEPSEEKIAEFKRDNLNPFKTMELSIAPLIGLKIIDTSVFSISKKMLNAFKKATA